MSYYETIKAIEEVKKYFERKKNKYKKTLLKKQQKMEETT